MVTRRFHSDGRIAVPSYSALGFPGGEARESSVPAPQIMGTGILLAVCFGAAAFEEVDQGNHKICHQQYVALHKHHSSGLHLNEEYGWAKAAASNQLDWPLLRIVLTRKTENRRTLVQADVCCIFFEHSIRRASAKQVQVWMKQRPRQQVGTHGNSVSSPCLASRSTCKKSSKFAEARDQTSVRLK